MVKALSRFCRRHQGVTMPTALVLGTLLWSAFASGQLVVEKPVVPPGDVRRVVTVIMRTAEENARRSPGRLEGDALGDLYIRSAALAASGEKRSRRAFLVGLGVALDDT